MAAGDGCRLWAVGVGGGRRALDIFNKDFEHQGNFVVEHQEILVVEHQEILMVEHWQILVLEYRRILVVEHQSERIIVVEH